MESLIKFTFDIFGHVIPGIIIMVAFSLLTFSFEPKPVVVNSSTSEVMAEIWSQNKATKKPEMKADYSMVSEIMNNLEGSGKGVFVIILAYIIGFAVSPFGKFLYRKIGTKLWPKIYVENDIKGMHISDKFILVREHSPANFEYVERWNMYSSLSHNLAVGCLVFIVVSIIQIFIEHRVYKLNWIVIAIISIMLFFVFIKSALVYNQWAGRDLNSAISALKLREKNNN